MINYSFIFAINPNIFTILADIATLVARYNVLQSINHEWLTMNLDTDYEDSLIQICILIFRYLGHASELVMQPTEKQDIISRIAQEIKLTDEHCRKFSFTIFGEEDLAREVAEVKEHQEERPQPSPPKRKFHDISDGSQESDFDAANTSRHKMVCLSQR